MKRLALAAPLWLISATLLSACTGKGQMTSAARTATTPPAAHAHTHTPTPAQASAFAAAVNLRAGDVPGFQIAAAKKPKHETAAEKRLQQQLRRCTGGPAITSVADVSSPEFKRAAGPFSQTVSSGVSVASSPAEAASELTALHAHDVRKCLTKYVQAALANDHFGRVTVAPVSVAAGTPPAQGATGSFAWRITSGLDVQRLRIPFYMDILGFVYGRAEVTLVSFGIPRAFPARSEEQLFTLLLQRAGSHSI